MSAPRPITLLIAALGGEGGGVLTDWIVSAAAEAGFPVQSTSIPGVAQRTGATTYYIEILPAARARAWRQAPGAGAHARRRRHRHRGGERIAGSRPHGGERLRHARPHASDRLDQPLLCHGREDRDGRRPLRPGQADQDRQGQCARRLADRHGRAREAKRLDHQRGDARRHRRLRRLPVTAEQFEAAIRADGKSVDSNLRGFRAGLEAARAKIAAGQDRRQKKPRADHARPARAGGQLFAAGAGAADRHRRRAAADRLSERRLCATLSRPAARIVDADAAAGAAGKLLKEVARHLAVRMSYEDVVRVAQAKIAPAAHAPHRARGAAREGRAVLGARFPQARHRGNVPAAAIVPGAADPGALPSAKAGSAASISAWRSTRPRSAAICAS